MENASKALIMAGAVLIALMVIAMLVFFFDNIKEWQNVKQGGEEVEQATEFNKQYDVYARNVYGSELLSIANKIDDYNKREAENKDYSKIELVVEIRQDIDKNYFTKGTYSAATLKEEVEKLQDEVETIGKVTIKSATTEKISRRVSALATMRTKDIEDLGFERTQYIEKVNSYNTYKTLLTEIKAKVFQYVNFSYDRNNGRITKMSYKI